MNAVSTTPSIDTSATQLVRKERPSSAVVPMPEATPMQMVAIAVQRGADLEYIKQLMDLQERWEARQAYKAFEAAMADAKAEIKPILKNREVDFTSQKGRTHYEYEDYAAVASEVDPILAKYGLNARHRPKQNGKSLTIICKIAHRDGHFEETELTADNDESGNKNSVQGIGSTATYLQRYTLKLALGLAATKDTDGRGATTGKPRVTAEQVANLKALLTEVGANEINFLKWLRVGSLSDILADHYDACVKAIEAKRHGG